MTQRGRRIFFVLYLFVVAPIGVIVLISALLLFHVPPPTVFAPGRAVRALIEMSGVHVANRVAVAGTAVFWWAIFAIAGWLWERRG